MVSTEVEVNLNKAVDDGVLLDVSHVAELADLNYPTYISAGFWNRPEIDRSEERLQVILRNWEDS